MGDTNIPFPIGGLNENWAQSDQPADTTRYARNMRSVDDTTGRTRGAKRSGMSKHFAAQTAASPIQFATTIVYDNKTITYEALEGELDSFGAGLGKLSKEWSQKTKPNKDAVNVKTDTAGNVFSLSGNVIEKWNPDGVQLWSFTVPLEVSTHTLGPMALGPDLAVYVGVDSGTGGQKGASVYRIGQSPIANSNDTEPELEWRWQTDAWVRELKLSGSELLILKQDDDAAESTVLGLVNITSAVPDVSRVVSVPYPSTCMVVREDGSSITGHPYYLNRDSLKAYPGVGIPLESWTPEDAPDGAFEVWADLRAEDLDLADGEAVTFWGDRTGHGRNLYEGNQPNGDQVHVDPPTFRALGSTGKPSLLFNGEQGLFSTAGGGTFAQSDACLSLLPNHGDGAFCVMILCRPATAKATDEVNDVGADVDAPRWLLDQLHHSAYEGSDKANFDDGYNEDHRSSLIVNSTARASNGLNDYTWSDTQDVKHGDHTPGFVRALTSASGYASILSNATGSTDAAFMPANRGAANAGWPKSAQFDDASADSPGEGLTVLTFFNCGGLNECIEIDGVFTASGLLFTADDPSAFNHLSLGSGVFLWSGGALVDGATYTYLGAGQLVNSGASYPNGPATIQAVPDRNEMSRSMLRSNGVTSDRWEALPMSYAGADGLLAGDDVHNKNVTANPTGLGSPMADGTLKGFKGEIMQILVLGRREDNSERVDLGGTLYHKWPTVVEHPLWAVNQRSGEAADPAWDSIGTNLDSTMLEKLEGWMVHRHGVSSRLPSAATGHGHPHYPAQVSGATFDIPLPDFVSATGQAWLPRKRSDEAMIIKHDASGKMLWCLLADTGVGFGDIFSEDIHGNTGVLGVTNARCSGGLALGLDGAIFVAGPGSGVNGDEFSLGVIYDTTDDDADLPLRGVGFWYIAGGAPPDTNKLGFKADATIRIASDEFGNLLTPCPPGTTYLGGLCPDAMRAFTEAGAYLFRLTTLSGGGSAPFQNSYAVALPPVNPDYHV